VVGEGTTAAGPEAFVWDEPNGLRALAEVLVDDYGIDLTGWTLTSARGISADGRTIVGFGTNPDGFTEAWAFYAVPEPAQALLAATGALALLAAGRRRARSQR
jgi:hypothetical protein